MYNVSLRCYVPLHLLLFIFVGVKVVPGTDTPVINIEDAATFVKAHGLPIILKAAYGGGGRGMRVVRNMDVSILNNSAFIVAFQHTVHIYWESKIA